MNSNVRFRILTLVGLAAFGVGLAWVGTAIGVGGPITDTRSDVEFTVSETNVTLVSDHRQVTVIDNMSTVETVAIEKDGDQFRVRTEGGGQLTDEETDRAVKIARDNETVRRYLDEMGEYELTVDLVEKLNTSSSRTITIDGLNESTFNESQQRTFTVENVTTQTDADSVTIDRNLPHVDNRVTVAVERPASSEVAYHVTVNLAEETVVGITDWEET